MRKLTIILTAAGTAIVIAATLFFQVTATTPHEAKDDSSQVSDQGSTGTDGSTGSDEGREGQQNDQSGKPGEVKG